MLEQFFLLLFPFAFLSQGILILFRVQHIVFRDQRFDLFLQSIDMIFDMSQFSLLPVDFFLLLGSDLLHFIAQSHHLLRDLLSVDGFCNFASGCLRTGHDEHKNQH